MKCYKWKKMGFEWASVSWYQPRQRARDAGFTWNSQHDTSYPVFIFFNADFWFEARLREKTAQSISLQQIYTLNRFLRRCRLNIDVVEHPSGNRFQQTEKKHHHHRQLEVFKLYKFPWTMIVNWWIVPIETAFSLSHTVESWIVSASILEMASWTQNMESMQGIQTHIARSGRCLNHSQIAIERECRSHTSECVKIVFGIVKLCDLCADALSDRTSKGAQ